MTTLIDFVPSNVAPFQFQADLDGATHNFIVTWNLFGRRYYVSCYDLGGNRVFTLPLIGSPAGIVLQSLTWAAGQVTAVAAAAHGYSPGSTIRFAISGASPDGFDGTFDALIVDAASFTYALALDPGPLVGAGSASRDVNIAGGYFDSTLVYRTPNRQFEVTP